MTEVVEFGTAVFWMNRMYQNSIFKTDLLID
jgi:hypothetical protein